MPEGLSGHLGEVVAVFEGCDVESAAECSVHGLDINHTERYDAIAVRGSRTQ